MRPSVLLINNGYPSIKRPHFVTYIKSIHDCLDEAGMEVTLLVMNSNFSNSFGKYYNYLKYYLRLLLYSKYQKFDYIYIHNYPSSFLPLAFHLHRLKNVYIHWHGEDIFEKSGLSGIVNKLSYLFLKKHYCHLTPSRYFKEQVSNKLHIDQSKIAVSPSGGIDSEVFKNQLKRSNKPGQNIVLGFASGMWSNKGMDLVHLLITETNQTDYSLKFQFDFKIIDYGHERDKYYELIHRFPNVTLLPPLPKNKMVDFYSSIDILLFPSIRPSESLGLTSLEAMSCNTPVIGTDAFAMKETIIPGQTGERFEYNNYSNFIKALILCCEKLETYHPRPFIIQNFSKQAVVDGYKQIFKLHA